MPFTLTHPVAVLPLCRWARKRNVLSALVIGSMIPDFGYFVPGDYVHAHTHTIESLLWFSLPAGYLVWWVYQVLVGPALIELAPPRWQIRLRDAASSRPVRGWGLLVVALAIGLGAFTHLLIDACTHADGFVGRNVPLLSTSLFQLFGRPFTVSRLLQHGFSVTGLLVLAILVFRWAGDRGDGSPSPWPVWKKAVVGCLFGLPALVAFIATGLHSTDRPLDLAAGYGIVLGLETLGLSLLAWGGAHRVWTWRQT